MPGAVRRLLAALVALAGILILAIAVWAIDVRRHDGQVVRNTRFAGRSIGGLTRAQLETTVSQVAGEFEGARIKVDDGGEGFETDAAALGVSVAPEETIDAAFDVGREGSVPARIAGWIRALAVPRTVSMRVDVDVAAVYRTVRDLDPGPRREPKEPRIVLEDGALTAADGEDGRGIDPADVIDALPDAAAAGEPFVVEVDRGGIEPRWSTDDVEELISSARRRIDRPVTVRAGGVEAEVKPARARSWLRSEATDDGLRLLVSEEAALGDLAQLLDDAGDPATPTRFTVEGGAVKIVPGTPGTQCCDEAAGGRLERALLEGELDTGPIDLPLTVREPELTEAEARDLKVVEPVATFTTRHAAGQPRVQNIHRIADLVRGQLIEPGETFSVNGFVGRRTKARGFVAAPVIEEGKFSEDVGGGISQFATTLFNAAFFAGLEFGEYQSHSIYISRYPYGREATLSYPHPDLEIENPSPYGVLVWPTYSADSITVTLYSTKWVEATQSGQTTGKRGNCTRVTTQRTRRWVEDGRTEVDRVFATYRPEEGVNC